MLIPALYCIPLSCIAQSDTALYVIQLYTGQTYSGRIVKQDSASVYFKKEGQEVLIVEQSNIKFLNAKTPKTERTAAKAEPGNAIADTTEDETFTDITLEAGTYACFIVTLAGDTQYGKMGVRSDEKIVDFQRVLRFINKEQKVILYRPAQLRSFTFIYQDEHITFESLENTLNIEVVAADNVLYYDVARANSFFFQRITTGYYHLYYLRRIRLQGIQRVNSTSKNGNSSILTSYSIQTDRYNNTSDEQLPLTTYPLNRYAVKRGNGKLVIMEEKKMADFFQDNPVLKSKILSKIYRYKNMPEVVKEYNRWKEDVTTIQRY